VTVRSSTSHVRVVAFVALCFGGNAAVLAEKQYNEEEWPCVQALVPEVVPGVVWPEYIEERGLWKKDQAIKTLGEQLSDLDSFTDNERDLIKQYIDTVPPAEMLPRLNLLADAIVTFANIRRTMYIDGIIRYTRQQIAIAAQIEDTLNQLVDLEEGDESRAEIEETLRWHERVYDQREQAIISLCERPVELEEVLSDILREVTYYLP